VGGVGGGGVLLLQKKEDDSQEPEGKGLSLTQGILSSNLKRRKVRAAHGGGNSVEYTSPKKSNY